MRGATLSGGIRYVACAAEIERVTNFHDRSLRWNCSALSSRALLSTSE